MAGSKFKNVTDATVKSFRDDPNDASLTEQAVTDQLTQEKLDTIDASITAPLIVKEYDAQTRSFSAITPSGTFETGELIRLIGGNFESGALPTTTWQTLGTNGGDATAVTGELLLSTNTTADGQADVQSTNRAEFVTATFNKAHLAFQSVNFSNTDVIREWGMFDPVVNILSGDGAFYRNNEGAIEVVVRKAGVDTVVEEVDFNGSAVTGFDNTFVKDDNIHIYEILYNAGKIEFFQDRKLIHSFNSAAAVAYETVHLTLGASVRNINGNTTNNQLKTRGFSCSRVGTQAAENDSITINGPGSLALKNSPGKLLNIIITNVGIGTANIELFDATDGTGAPFATLDLTESLVDLSINRRLDNGLFYVATGSGFEILINWR